MAIPAFFKRRGLGSGSEVSSVTLKKYSFHAAKLCGSSFHNLLSVGDIESATFEGNCGFD